MNIKVDREQHPGVDAVSMEASQAMTGSGGWLSELEAALILKLKTFRDKRPAPVRDDKVLTDQNPLILEAFSRLARYRGGDRYRQAAIELAGILVNQANQAGKYLERISGVDANITDYGYLAMGLTAVYSITGDWLATGDGAYYSTPVEDQDLYKRAISDEELE